LTIERLSPYVAIDRRLALANGETLPKRSSGSTLFVDISGYTKLTESFVEEHGTLQGADRMTYWLNQAYDCLISQIHRFGGSVVGFSGDAMTCWFEADLGHRACIAAYAMRKAIGKLSSDCAEEESVGAIAIKVSIASGIAQRLRVGEPRFRYYDLLAGKILARAAIGEQLAGPNEIIIHRSTREGMGSDVRVHGVEGSDDYFVFRRLGKRVPNAPWNTDAVQSLDSELLRPWLLPPVFKKINAGQDDYLAELRRCVSLFLKFSGLEDSGDEINGFLDEGRMEAFVSQVQTTLDHYGGYLIQLTVGDKGSYLYAAFGAPLGHDDDPQRAVSAAEDLMSSLGGDQNFEPQIGLAHGLMRTGGYGGLSRRTYGVLGDAVNTAARLMARAKPGQVLMTRSLAQAISSRETVNEIGVLELKGKAQPLTIFELNLVKSRSFRRTLSRSYGHYAGLSKDSSDGIELNLALGRELERKKICDYIHSASHGPRLLIVEGEAGMGKSTVIREVFKSYKKAGSRVLFGSGDSVEFNTPYFPWRSVFSELLETQLENTPLKTRREAIVASLPAEHQSRAPLLESVLPLDWPDNADTSDLMGEARSDRTLDLLIALLQVASAKTKLFFVIEDGHWVDSASWQLIRRIQHQLENVCFVMTSRPISGPIPLDFEFLRNRPETEILVLSALTPNAIYEMVCRNLGVDSLPDVISKLIIDKAEGHPFFSEEFAYSLRDSGILSIQNGECMISDHSIDLSTLDFPDTVQGIVTSRLDSLSMSELLTIKVASVVGRKFSLGIIADTYPGGLVAEELLRDIHVLVTKDLIQPLPGPDAEHFQFKHAITQVAVYNMLLQTQRKELHRSAATWLEEQKNEESASLYPLLAHHWCQTVDQRDPDPADLKKAIEYVDLAAIQATKLFANHEAARFYLKLIELHHELGEDRPLVQLSNWHGQLGRAYYGMGQLADSRTCLQDALTIIGYAAPRTRLGSLMRFTGQLCRKVFSSITGVTPTKDKATLDEIKGAISWYLFLGAIAMLEANALEAMRCAVTMLNLAERTGMCVESIGAYGFTCLVAGLIPAPKVAENYNVRCLEAIEKLGPRSDDNGSAYPMLGLYHSSYGHWEQGKAILERGCEYSLTIGSRRRWEECQGLLAMIDVCMGSYDNGLEKWRSIYESGLRRGDPQPQAWGTSGEIEVGLKIGLTADKMEGLIDRATQLIHESVNPADEIRIYGLLARLLWASDMKQEAFNCAWTGLQKMNDAVPTLVYTFEGWTSLAAVLLWACESEKGAAEVYGIQRQDFTKTISRGFKILDKMAGLFAISKARIYLYKGLFEKIAGRPGKADSLWYAALSQARKLGMCYDEAIILTEIGRHKAVGSADRESNLGMARDMFEQMGALGSLALCEKLIGKGQS
jgi:class 3 adenylate cyclase/tetratricopeptide (TPR) repeat protein